MFGTLITDIQKMSPKKGDVIVVTTFERPDEDFAFNIHQELAKFGIDGVLILVAAVGVDMQCLNEDMMKTYGWIRDPMFEGGVQTILWRGSKS